MFSVGVQAADHDHAHGPMLGGGVAVETDDLPVGRFRNQLENLPATARGRALGWLRGFSFTAADAEHLHADASGAIYYADEPANEPIAAANAPLVAAAAVPVTPFPASLSFHSKPGSAKVIYLDFTGHSVSGTAWNTDLNRDPIVALAYSTDSDRTTFSDAEQVAIQSIWQRVAEDYAPFDVDVTTEEPAVFNTRTARVLITRNTDADGQPNPASTSGGVAYVNVFGISNFATYAPAWVYQNNLSNVAQYIAEAASHEAGHNMGLSHDGKTDGTDYYNGHGSGEISWAPIMGVGYNRNVSQWSKGEYYLANNTQDDLAVVAGKLAYRIDDHGNTRASASFLTVQNGTDILSTTPETDPDNSSPMNKGVIDRNSDDDFFAFSTGAGAINLHVKPWRNASGSRGGNLDVLAELYDDAGTLITSSNPETLTDATLSATVSAGVYYLKVSGTGTGSPTSTSPSGYTPYASLGQYFVIGTIVDNSGVVIPPQAESTLADINATGENRYTFDVHYTDDVAIQSSTLDDADVRVTGPNGYDVLATLVSVNTSGDGSPRVATYEIFAPGPTWSPLDNGTYTLTLLSEAVGDIEGAFVASEILGAFSCQVPESIYLADLSNDPGFSFDSDWAYGSPSGSSGDPTSGFSGAAVIGYNLNGTYASRLTTTRYATSPAINCSGASTVTLTFKRWLGVRTRDTASIDVSNDGVNWTPVWFSSGDILDGGWTTLQYDLSAVAANQPGVHVRWGMASNRDPRTSYGWNLDNIELLGNGDGIDTIAPSAYLSAVNITQNGGPIHEFTVTYTDEVAVASASLDSNDILVTGPQAFSNLAQFVGTDDPSDGSPRTATYRIDAPGGNWDPADNGIYTVTLLDAEVQDTSNNTLPETMLGGFEVALSISMQEILIQPVSLLVQEGSTNGFDVSLAEAPASPLTVFVARFSGDSNLVLNTSSNLTFDALNYAVPQRVIVAALPDPDQLNGTAVFRCSALNLTAVDLSVTEVDTTPDPILTTAVNASAWGRIEPAMGRFPQGTILELTAVPSNYYGFSGWSGDLSGTTNPVEVLMDADHHIEATFVALSTTNHPTPLWWLAEQGITNEFEQAVGQLGVNGLPLWESYIAGLDSNDPDQRLEIHLSLVPQSLDPCVISWATVSGRVYSISWTPDLHQPFTEIPNAQAMPWTVNSWTDTVHSVKLYGAYQIGVRLEDP
ncbi:MAG: hypothetical protein ACI9QL_004731 [Candidatus Omnitrophota bacterium]|jgi:hypothetical protein